jgi:hypothetical protein
MENRMDLRSGSFSAARLMSKIDRTNDSGHAAEVYRTVNFVGWATPTSSPAEVTPV